MKCLSDCWFHRTGMRAFLGTLVKLHRNTYRHFGSADWFSAYLIYIQRFKEFLWLWKPHETLFNHKVTWVAELTCLPLLTSVWETGGHRFPLVITRKHSMKEMMAGWTALGDLISSPVPIFSAIWRCTCTEPSSCYRGLFLPNSRGGHIIHLPGHVANFRYSWQAQGFGRDQQMWKCW